ncbi:S41 family peptidase [candidate division KSB1 bacterium]|nr:S41 family peptidase [candidate division KSB1 bacterium]
MEWSLDAKIRKEVIEGALQALNENYIFPEVAGQMEQSVRGRMKKKEYDNITDPGAFANTLTAHLQEVSRDKHLRVSFSREVLPQRDHPRQETPEERERRRAFAAARNYGFEKVEHLSGNIGYLDLRGFMDAALAEETAAAAMTFVADASALIIDLRNNNGGEPEMVALLSSYLFDKPVHLNDIYSRTENKTQEYWTRAGVAGKRYGESKDVYVLTRYGESKDVYVLTSRRTFSAAEEFTYNLKNLKRATIVGETTGGGAHPVMPVRLHDHFRIMAPFARAINPITKTNWEGTGVKPDIETPASQALQTAHVAALKSVLAKTTEPQEREQLQQALAIVQREIEAANDSGGALNSETPDVGIALPNTPAGKTLAAFVRAFNTGNPAALRRFHEEHGGNPENAEQDIAFYEQSGGLKLHSVALSNEYDIEILLQAKKDGRWLSFAINVAVQAPHGITDIRARPASPPSTNQH